MSSASPNPASRAGPRIEKGDASTRLGDTLASRASPDPALPQGGKENLNYAAVRPPQSRETPGRFGALPGPDFHQGRGVLGGPHMPVQDRGSHRTEKNKKTRIHAGRLPYVNSGLRACCIMAPPRFAESVSIFAALRSAPSAPCSAQNSPWGKNPARRGARGIFRSAENFFVPGGALQGIALARLPHARTPKAGRFWCVSAVLFCPVFPTVPWPFCGCGSCGKGCAGSSGP